MSVKVWWNEKRGKWYLVDRTPGRKRKMEVLGPTEQDRLDGEAAAKRLNEQAKQERTRAAKLTAGEPVLGEHAIQAWWDVAQHGRNKNSQTTGAWLIRAFLIPYFGKLDLRRLTRTHVQGFGAQMAREARSRRGTPLAHHTIHDALSLVRCVLYWLEEQQHLEFRLPVRFVCKLGGEAARSAGARKGIREAWTHEDADRLMQLAERKKPVHDVLLVARHTGARKGELLGLQWPQIDFSTGEFTIRESLGRDGVLRQTKTGNVRQVKMSREVIELLRGLARARLGFGKSHDRVFLGPKGEPWGYYEFSDAWAAIRNRAHSLHGVRDLPFHSWRHSYVSWALKAGVDPLWIARQIGDRVDTMLRHYAHFVPGLESDHSFVRTAGGNAAQERQLEGRAAHRREA